MSTENTRLEIRDAYCFAQMMILLNNFTTMTSMEGDSDSI